MERWVINPRMVVICMEAGQALGSWSGTWTQDSAALSKAGVSGLLQGSRRQHPPATLVGFLHLHVYRVVSR